MTQNDSASSAALPAALGAGSLAVALLLLLTPPAAGPVAAVFPPWWDGTRVLRAAGAAGPVVRFGALPFIIIVVPDHRDLLRQAGAWLVLDPRGLGGCTSV